MCAGVYDTDRESESVCMNAVAPQMQHQCFCLLFCRLSDAPCSVKASTLKQIHRLNSKRLLVVFVCALHYDVLF